MDRSLQQETEVFIEIFPLLCSCLPSHKGGSRD